MSFYTQSDDDDDEAITCGFICLNCGGSESYRDDSGDQVCADCFTQSQDAREATFEYEEIQAMTARTRNGQAIGVKFHGRKGPGRCRRKPLLDMDKSRPIPSLHECIEGFQYVLKRCIDIVTEDILEESDSDTATSIRTTVKHLWMGYLRAWRDAAEFYGRYHPEVRFSLRDSFLVAAELKAAVQNQIAFEVQEKFKKEVQEGTVKVRAATQAESVEGVQDEVESTTTSGKITQMLDIYKRKGRHEIVLRETISLRMIASLLCVPLSALGFTGRHILQWIATGELPLLQAFQTCLSLELQDKLLPVQSFFRLEKLPYSTAIEDQARALMFISGLGSPWALITPKSLPLLVARWVQDMGLGQRVLDLSLSLMGLLDRKVKKWLPSPLAKAKPESLTSKAKIVATMIVACKMCPGWETWKFGHKVGEKFIPWNDAHARRTETIQPYITFLETTGLLTEPDERTSLPGFMTNSIQEVSETAFAPELNKKETPSAIVDGGVTRYAKCRGGDKDATENWREVNGVGHYVFYDRSRMAIGPYHPQMEYLIEYMAYMTDTTPQDIRVYIAVLERDLEPNHKRKREFIWPSSVVHLCTNTVLASKAKQRSRTKGPPRRLIRKPHQTKSRPVAIPETVVIAGVHETVTETAEV